MGPNNAQLLWALVAAYATLVFLLGEPVTAGLSAGAFAGMLRRRQDSAPAQAPVATPRLLHEPLVRIWAAAS